MPWCVPEEGLGWIYRVITEIDGCATAGNACIRIVVTIVSCYSDCTAENYIDSRSMGVEINSIVIIMMQWLFTIFCFII